MSEPTHISYEVSQIMVEACLEKLRLPPKPDLIRERLLELDQVNEKTGGPELIAHIPEPGMRVMSIVVRMSAKLLTDHATNTVEIPSLPVWALQAVTDTVIQLPNLQATLSRLITPATREAAQAQLNRLKRRVHGTD